MDWSLTRGRRKQPSSVITCEDCQPSEDDGPIPGLLVKDTLTVVTPSGECKIELCLGDITKLPQQDKVDVILISAYGGCYSKGVGVMGALYRQMDMDVYQLAKSHKEEDLQDLYSCWWTKPLPEHLPYKRLLCFETRGSTTFSGVTGYDLNRGAKGRPSELVSHAFRCLVPILNNQDGTVITPLLNSGSQGCDECEMLQGMVENAVNWMKAGLPLRLLKIVIYSKVMSRTTASMILQRADGTEILDLFSQLKQRLETKSPIPKEVKLDYDIYLSFSPKDQSTVDSIQTALRTIKPDIRIYLSNQKLDEDAIWQNDIYAVMTKSARVITVLSPNYLGSPDCLEQYNIALCCNRQSYRDILAPFYIATVTLPTYMGLVQYSDCRDDPEVQITNTCQQLIKSLPPSTQESSPEDGTTTTIAQEIEDDEPFCYDVFVSYSHCDSEAANYIVGVLKELDPTLRVFYDIQELKTGHAWQQTLYHSIDGSRSMLAVLSNNYLRSAVCQEEYSLAQMKHLAQDKLKLIPLRIEELEKEESSFTEVAMVTATPDVFKVAADTVCHSLVSWLHGKTGAKSDSVEGLSNLLAEAAVSDRLNIENLMEVHRKKTFKNEYKTVSLPLKDVFPPKCFISEMDEDKAKYHEVTGEVILSFHPHDEKFALSFKSLLEWAAPKVVVLVDAPSDQERLHQLDNARHIVAFLSPHYVESPKHVEEFHIALWRQRVSPVQAPLLLPVKVLKLAWKPTYFQLVGSMIDLWDAMWPSLDTSFPRTGWLRSEELLVSRSTSLALMELGRITIEIIQTAKNLPEETELKVRPALLNPVQVKAEIKALAQATKKHTWGHRSSDSTLMDCTCIVCQRTQKLFKNAKIST
ncbi:uncharacterized protein LOC121422541 [Lytechinus variegatus]|uniref:uncharacterized protein LOC121422541 n=1 Tax=Lytechinus variegatus TaxID=7654 RepID=UPI001BB1219F|nr:uncharacterized protein LOC121422541 [Lytechinus variegatus]XP_041473615.1 uncharacterized protein LOC121422541 [Lytechinus variegatus]